MSEELKAAQARIAELEGALSWHEEQRNDMAELRAELEHRNKLISDMQAAWDMALHTIGRQNAELAAIKAQEPAFMWHKGATEDESEVVDVDCACPCCVPLYAAPVSEAKAQGVVMPEHETSTPSSKWASAGEPDPHGKAYDCERAELSMGEYTDDELANAVFMHDHRSFDIAATMRGEPGSIVLLTAAKDRIRWLSRSLDKALARLSAAPVQQVSVPDVSLRSRVSDLIHLLQFAKIETPTPTDAKQAEIAMSDLSVMLAAAPAAPAADAGLVEALKQAFPLFDEDGLNELYHHCEIAVLGDRKRLHKLLATHSAKGVV